MNALRLIAISNNLGDSKSLATHPATTTHMRIGAEERARLGITDGVIRLSVGLEDAADLCADLARGWPPLPWRPSARRPSDGGRLHATTRAIAVTVQPFYLEDQSEPDEGRFVWAYRVRIRNAGPEPVQLISRTWRITDGRGRTIEVEGPGVVGEQPVARARRDVRVYVGHAVGDADRLHGGHYHMVAAASGESFDVAIPAFSLDSPHGGAASLAARTDAVA